jgi:hypothetical protein
MLSAFYESKKGRCLWGKLLCFHPSFCLPVNSKYQRNGFSCSTYKNTLQTVVELRRFYGNQPIVSNTFLAGVKNVES